MKKENFGLIIDELENVLDTLFLSKKCQLKDSSEDEIDVIKEDQPKQKPTETLPEKKKEAREEQENEVNLYEKKRGLKDDSFKVKVDYLSSPKKPTLQHYREWEKAFKVLSINAVDKRKEELDIENTVDWIAQTDIFQLIYKQKIKKSFTLTFVIDKHHSMDIFDSLISDFCNMVEHYGVFEKVYYFYIDGQEEQGTFYRDRALNQKVKYSSITREEQNLVLLLSSCISPAWRSNSIYQHLNNWTKKNFCSIIQMLPLNMRRLTTLKQGKKLTWKSSNFYPNNSELNSKKEFFYFDKNTEILRIPVISFEHSSFTSWANVVKGDSRYSVGGMGFKLEDIRENREVIVQILTSKERLDNFLSQASSTAKQLAAYLANNHVSFEIARIIQELKFPDSTTAHLSEIFLGGIIERHVASDENVNYDFYEGIRDVLKHHIAPSEALELFNKTSKFVSEYFDSAHKLSTMIQNPNSAREIEWDKSMIAFAKIGTDILKRKGGVSYSKGVEFEKEILKIERKPKDKYIYFREDIYQMILAQIKNNNNIFLNAPKRFGKTTFLLKLEEILSKKYIVYYLNAKKYNDSDNFFNELLKLQESSIRQEEKLIILIDELPFIFQENKEFSDKFRATRLEGRSKISYIIADDIKYFDATSFNDIMQIELTPLKQNEAIQYITKNIKDYDIDIDIVNIQYIIEKIGLLIPYNLNIFLNHLVRNTELDSLNKKNINYILHDIIKKGNDYFNYIESELKNYFKNNTELAFDILDYLSIKNTLNKDYIEGVLESKATIVPRGMTYYFTDTFISNGYVKKVENNYMFTSYILQEWWKNKIQGKDRILINIVINKLVLAGWYSNSFNVLKEFKLPNNHYVDILLEDNKQPLAVIEVKSKIKNFNSAVAQVISYAKELNVSFAYLTDGDEIHEFNIYNDTSKTIEQYPSSIELRIRAEDQVNYKVLWVDDRPDNNKLERNMFKKEGIEFDLAFSTNEALEYVKANQYLAIVSDMGRKEGPQEGYVFLEKLRKFDKETPVFFYAGSNLQEHKEMAMERGAQGSTNNSRELHDVIMKVMKKKLKYNHTYAKYLTSEENVHISQFIGRKKELNHLANLIKNTNSLSIIGAAGIGKTSLIKQYIATHEDNYQYIAYIPTYHNFEVDFISAFSNSLKTREFSKIYEKLNNLNGKKILIIDDVTLNIVDEKEYLSRLVKHDWTIITISRDKSFDTLKSHYSLEKMSTSDAKEVFLAIAPSKFKKGYEHFLQLCNYTPTCIIQLAKQIQDDSISPYSMIGDISLNNKDYEQAIKLYKQAIMDFNTDSDAFYNLGVAYYHTKRFQESIEAYKKAIELNPKESEFYLGLGLVYDEIGEYHKALEFLHQAHNLEPKKFDILYNMGVVYGNIGELDKAIEIYSKAIETNPNDYSSFTNIGSLYIQQNKFDKALDMSLRAIEINPEVLKAYNNIGVIYHKQAKYHEVLEVFTRMVELDKESQYKELAIDIMDSNIIDLAIKSTLLVNLSALSRTQIDEIKQIIQKNLSIYIGQILGSSYSLIIQLSKEDKQKLSNEIVWIDIRKYGIDNYLMNPNEKETTEHDKERFNNILGNAKKGNWKFELRLNNLSPDKNLGITYLTSKIFVPIENYKNEYFQCQITNLNNQYMLKIKLNKNDKQKIFKGQLTIDIRDYYEIYNNLKSKANSNYNNNRSQYDKLIKKLEIKCWKIDLKIIEDNIGDNNIIYMSENIFEYTQKPLLVNTVSPIEKKLIQSIRKYDINKYIHLSDFTKTLSKQLNIPRNTVIRILYRWKVFEKIDLAQESCISDLEINRNALVYILSLKI